VCTLIRRLLATTSKLGPTRLLEHIRKLSHFGLAGTNSKYFYFTDFETLPSACLVKYILEHRYAPVFYCSEGTKKDFFNDII